MSDKRPPHEQGAGVLRFRSEWGEGGNRRRQAHEQGLAACGSAASVGRGPSAWSRQAPATPWRGRRPPPSALYHSRGPSARGAPAAIDRDARLWYNGRVPGAAFLAVRATDGAASPGWARIPAGVGRGRAGAPRTVCGGAVLPGRKEAAMDTIYLYALNVSALDADSAVWEALASADRRARMAALKRLDDRRRSLGAELALHAALSPASQGLRAPGGLYAPAGRQACAAGRGGLATSASPTPGTGRYGALHRAPGGRGRGAQVSALRPIPVREWVGRGELSETHGRGAGPGAFRTLMRGGDGDLPPGARAWPVSPAARWAIVCSAPPRTPPPRCI